MASYQAARAKHATLTGATPDLVELTGTYTAVEVYNRDSSDPLYVKIAQARIDPDDAAVEGDDTIVVPPLRVLTEDLNGTGRVWVALAGAGNGYSVQGLPG